MPTLQDKILKEKSEAQLRNEEEVRRIIRERGYQTSINDGHFESDVSGSSIIKLVLSILLLIGAGVCWYFLQNRLPEKKDDNTSSNDYVTAYTSQDYIDFNSCLGSIDDSTILIDDNDY